MEHAEQAGIDLYTTVGGRVRALGAKLASTDRCISKIERLMDCMVI